MNPTFSFDTELYLWKDEGSWVFVDVPVDVSEEIEDIVPGRRGFGSVPVDVAIGETTWRTSIFPDSKRGRFVLPLKQAVRRREEIDVGDQVAVDLTIRID